MAPGCNIIALKVLNNSGSGASSDIEEALQWVAANRATFNIVAVNMSLGTFSNNNSPTLSVFSDEIAALENNDVAVVCASGNAYPNFQSQGVSTPSSDPSAWSVGAVWDRDTGFRWNWSNGAIDFSTGPDRIISFSQRSTTMTTVFAPGGQIWGATADGNPNNVSYFSGTSQASPHVAGLVADMQQLAMRTSGHLMSVNDLRSTMVASATSIFDGDDENDNVPNTFTFYPRVDALAWGGAILNKLFAGTADNDTLNGTVVGDTIHGQGGNDAIAAGWGTDTLFGEGGNDALDGGAGSDTMFAGAGNDSYFVDNAGDQVIENANEGTDTVLSTAHFRLTDNAENLVLQGNDNLQGAGNNLNNLLFGNAGNNILTGGAGADAMFGGAGNDVYFADDAGDQGIENANEGTDTVFSTAHLRLTDNVENLVLQGSDNLQAGGNSLSNALYGNSGNNIVDGHAGADAMFGGAGNDVYFADDAGDQAIENANEGTDTVFSTAHLRLTANMENLVLQGSADLQAGGNGLDNVLYGNTGSNVLDGDAGADIMVGGDGNDVYFIDNTGDTVFEVGGEGADAVFATVSHTLAANVETLVLQGAANIFGTGNAGANSLVGNSGDNTLNGGGAADLLIGNAGNDTFVFHVGEANGDTVLDFAGNGTAAGDSLRFVGYGAGATFTNVDATHAQVNYNAGASHDVITFTNGAVIDPSDVLFM